VEAVGEGERLSRSLKTMIPDYRHSRLATLKQQVSFHQEEQRRVATDHAVAADLRAMLVTYHDTILRRLQEHVTALESR
jgi:hypothetical protein